MTVPNYRTDPVNDVEFILRTYSGPALSRFKIQLREALGTGDSFGTVLIGKAGSVERSVQKIIRALRTHPERFDKKEAIRRLLDL